MLDKLDRADVPVALVSASFPFWAQMLAIWLQILLAALGIAYILMRMYREKLLIKVAARQVAGIEHGGEK